MANSSNKEESKKHRRGQGSARWIRIVLRSAHILSFGVLLGGHIFGIDRQDLLPWLWASIGTGALMMASYTLQKASWFRELYGLVVLAKIGILCLLLLEPLWPLRVPILIFVLFVSSISSHMPGKYRYWTPGGKVS